MTRSLGVCGLAILATALLGSAPAVDPDDLVRQGNAAFERGDYAAAADLYARAEDATADPGLIAVNRAAALYRLAGQPDSAARRPALYREAELHYRRGLEDAAGPRRLAALYGLGNSLLQQGPGRGAAVLQDAVRCYELCLRQDDLAPEFAADVRHNLELAKLLWREAKLAKNNPNANSSDGSDDPPPRRPTKPEEDPRAGTTQAVQGTPGPGGDKVRAQVQPGETPTRTDETPPGPGNLPPVPDSDELVPLPPEDALAHLQRAASRVLRERQEHRLRSVKPPLGSVKDW